MIIDARFRLLGPLALAIALVLGAEGHAGLGDCGQPVSTGDDPTASDALFALRVVVGLDTCALEVCDVDHTGVVTAGDALRILLRAVDPSVILNCPVPTTTTSTTTTTTTTPTTTMTTTTTTSATTSTTSTTTTTVPSAGLHLQCAAPQARLKILSDGLSAELPLVSSLSIDCGDIATGGAECSCALGAVAPVNFGSLGVLCIESTDACAGGGIDCTGTSATEVGVISDHTIGTCADNSACESACEQTCSEAGAAFESSACEGFCVGGANAGQACTQPTDCPESLCHGDVASHGNLCTCHCLSSSAIPPVAGAMSCRIGLRLAMEAAAPCDGLDEETVLGRPCLLLTSTAVTAELRDFNLAIAVKDGGRAQGASQSCENLATTGAGGLTLVGATSLVDTQLGDLIATVRAPCSE